jgi:hypothetical protein
MREDQSATGEGPEKLPQAHLRGGLPSKDILSRRADVTAA